ncbi:alpha beta hydrolase fold-1 protein [Purpureocillium lilacinum]|uniref:Alpha beta hydrolase fold-1 protein n=1 Tax=Purpureocillium lilacinum TaxID=33203 RepID=A0A179GGB9_PURLI|nr:alpha beta hydrolase fold-1 protein [Purpureocillium lilacinum]
MARVRGVFSFGSGPWDPSHRFETSWLLSPWLLFAVRALFSVYAFVTLFFIIGWECTHDAAGGCRVARQSFSYFTVLTYWGLAFYLLAAAVHTGTYALTGRPLLDRLPQPLRALHSLFYTTVVTLPFLVTIVFWAVIYKGAWFPTVFEGWHNVSQHAMNSLFALFELVVPRTAPPNPVHLLWLILILLGYLAVAYVTLADQGFYTYSFLDHDAVGGRGYVAAYAFGIAVAIVIIFGVAYGLIWLRRWVTETKLGVEGKLAEQEVCDGAEMSTIQPKDREASVV